MSCVSVILPTRDRAALVGRALAGVLAQTHADLEVLLVDNNQAAGPVSGQPGLQELLADPRVRLVPAPAAANAAAARNAGLREARGEWVTFLDDDDEYASDKIARQLAVATAAGAPLVLCGFEVSLGVRRRWAQVTEVEFSGDGLLLDAIWGTPFLFHRRDPAHLFDESLGAAEDLEYAQRFLARHNVARVPNVPAPLVIVHPQPGARTNTRHEDHWDATRRVLAGHRGRYSRTAGRIFLLRALLQRHKGAGGSWRRLLGAGGRLIHTGGRGELRRVLNAWLHRTGWFNRWLVS